MWLTSNLRAAGVLPHGVVAAVESRPNAAFNSFTAHLTVTYSADSPAGAPRRLLLKRSRPEAWAIEAGARETAFYRLAMTRRAALPMIVPCYAAAHDADSGASYVLLADLSESHRPPLTREQQLAAGENVPPDEVCERVVETLARFHAAWWGRPLLGGATLVGRLHRDRQSEQGWAAYIQRRADAWASLVAAEDSWFPDDLRRLYETALARASIVWERYLGPRLTTRSKITLIHGDAYFANFLYPNDDTGQIYLIDWQSPEANLGAGDLVNLIATFWTPAQRRAGGREERLLRRYLDTLHACGVTDYDWADLLTDYRLSLIEWLLAPLQDRLDGAGRDYWWPKMQCLARAYQELDCASLLIA